MRADGRGSDVDAISRPVRGPAVDQRRVDGRGPVRRRGRILRVDGGRGPEPATLRRRADGSERRLHQPGRGRRGESLQRDAHRSRRVRRRPVEPHLGRLRRRHRRRTERRPSGCPARAVSPSWFPPAPARSPRCRPTGAIGAPRICGSPPVGDRAEHMFVVFSRSPGRHGYQPRPGPEPGAGGSRGPAAGPYHRHGRRQPHVRAAEGPRVARRRAATVVHAHRAGLRRRRHPGRGTVPWLGAAGHAGRGLHQRGAAGARPRRHADHPVRPVRHRAGRGHLHDEPRPGRRRDARAGAHRHRRPAHLAAPDPADRSAAQRHRPEPAGAGRRVPACC